MRPQRRIRVVAGQVRRRNHELEAFSIGGGGAIAYVHVAAANPLRAGSDPNLVARTIVAHGSPCRMGTMAKVVARRQRVRATCSSTGVDGIVPVKVVVGGNAIPTPILGLERIVGPALARIQVTHNHPLAGKAHCPD
jgi:hypothetical protein